MKNYEQILSVQNGVARQGDVLVLRLEDTVDVGTLKQIPNDRNGSAVVLAYGEVTGHAHELDAKLASLYEFDGGKLLDVRQEAILGHEEHFGIRLDPGQYKVVQQLEYTPGQIRNVAD